MSDGLNCVSTDTNSNNAVSGNESNILLTTPILWLLLTVEACSGPRYSAVTSKCSKSAVKQTAPEFRLLCALPITQIFDTLVCALSAWAGKLVKCATETHFTPCARFDPDSVALSHSTGPDNLWADRKLHQWNMTPPPPALKRTYLQNSYY